MLQSDDSNETQDQDCVGAKRHFSQSLALNAEQLSKKQRYEVR